MSHVSGASLNRIWNSFVRPQAVQQGSHLIRAPNASCCVKCCYSVCWLTSLGGAETEGAADILSTFMLLCD